MQVEVNGIQQDIAPDTRLIGLLAQLNLAPERIAVEINLTVVDKKQLDILLHEGDKVEIISFVGGGADYCERT